MRGRCHTWLLATLVAFSASAQERAATADRFAVSLTSGASGRASDLVDASLPVHFEGFAGPTFRVRAAGRFLPWLGVSGDFFGGVFRVRNTADTTIAATVVEGALEGGVFAHWAPFQDLWLQGHVRYGAMVWPSASFASGAFSSANVVSHGPALMAVVGIEPLNSLGFSFWGRLSTSLNAQVGRANVGSAPSLQAGVRAAFGRWSLGSTHLSIVGEYEYSIGRVNEPGVYELNLASHRFGLGLELSALAPKVATPVVETPKPLEPVLLPPSLVVTVVGDASAPIAKAQVQLHTSTLETNEAGRLTVLAPKVGATELRVTAPGFRVATQAIDIAAHGETAVTVTLVRPTGPGRLTGLVSIDGAPATQCEVVVGKESARCDEQGHYVIAKAGPGPVSVKVSAPTCLDADEVVQVPPEGDAKLDVTLLHKPAAAVLRGLVRAEGATSITVRIAETKAKLELGPEGRFNVELPAGTYHLTVEAKGFVTQTRKLDVASGDQTIYHFDMRPLR